MDPKPLPIEAEGSKPVMPGLLASPLCELAHRGCQVDLDLDGRFLGDTHDVSARDVRDDCDGLPDGAGALLERVEVLAVDADHEV